MNAVGIDVSKGRSMIAIMRPLASGQVQTLPFCQSTKSLITQAINQVNAISSTLADVRTNLRDLAASLPEFEIVLAIRGVDNILGPQLMAEIGDVRRFAHKESLVAFAGVDAPPFQSGSFESTSRCISKRGSPALRKPLFQVMACLLQTAPNDDAVFQFPDRKRPEGKRFNVYMLPVATSFCESIMLE